MTAPQAKPTPMPTPAPTKATSARPLSLSERIVVFSQMSQMLENGLSIIEALNLAAHSSSPKTAGILGRTRDRIEGGSSLAAALESERAPISDSALPLLRAGEESGALPAAFSSLAASVELRLKLRRQIIRSFIYPFALFTLVFFVPQLPRLISGGWGSYLRVTLLPYSICLAVLFGLFVLLPPLVTRFFGAEVSTRIVRSLPLFGRLMDMASRIRFARHLAAALEAGLTLFASLRLAAEASGDARWQRALSLAERTVDQGGNLHDALMRTGLLDNEFLMTVASGERSGDLTRALQMHVLRAEATLTHRLNITVQIGSVLILIASYVFAAGAVVGQYQKLQGIGSGQLDQLLKTGGSKGNLRKQLDRLRNELGDGKSLDLDLDNLIETYSDPAGNKNLPQEIRDALK
jgi:type II secretory pathway component PulF